MAFHQDPEGVVVTRAGARDESGIIVGLDHG
jgi:hypothetical protein